MSTKSKIQWTQATWNPVAGCALVSPGCTNCYAMKSAYRLAAMGQAKYHGLTVKTNGRAVWTGKIWLGDQKTLEQPLHWKEPRMIFVNSMSDLFHPDVPFEFVDKVFAIMALCPQHTFQILTKRTERMADYLAKIEYPMQRAEQVYGNFYVKTRDHGPGAAVRDRRFVETWGQETADTAGDTGWPLRNVWAGTSTENQQTADERTPHLRKCPAAVRFLSIEPLIGPIVVPNLSDISWVIVGGESGPHARPCDVVWIRSIVQQAKAAGVPCFVKQLGANVIEPLVTAVRCGTLPIIQAGWPEGTEIKTWFEDETAHDKRCPPGRVKLKDHKGGDPDEWPIDLRVREFPQKRGTP